MAAMATEIAPTKAKRGPKPINCENCGTTHYRVARCANGERLMPGNEGKGRRRKQTPQTEELADIIAENAAIEEAKRTATVSVPPAETVTSLITDPAEIKALTPEDLRKQAEADWHKAEEAGKAAYGPDFTLNRPAILRDKSEVAKEELLRQLGAVQAEAQRDPRSRAAMLAANRVDPAQKDKDDIAAMQTAIREGAARAEANESAADRKARMASDIPNGEQVWVCGNGHRFRSMSQDRVRVKGRQEPGWQLHCRDCGDNRVRVLADKDI